jgi:hypothetical protein
MPGECFAPRPRNLEKHKQLPHLPVVVFRVEQEIGSDDSDADCDDQQDDENQQHKAVHVVHLGISGARAQTTSQLLGMAKLTAWQEPAAQSRIEDQSPVERQWPPAIQLDTAMC